MQRQAVPLLVTEPPIVATGPGRGSRPALRHGRPADRDGYVLYVDSERVICGHEKLKDGGEGARVDQARAQGLIQEYVLRKFVGLNERTCLNQKPIVKVGREGEEGPDHRRRGRHHQGELALGRNVLVAFMSWDGYNFEDAIIISERLVKNDTYTSIHIEEFDIEIRETKLGKEEFTRDIPNVSPKALSQPGRQRHRPHRHLRRAGRHPRRQGVAEDQERTDSGRKAAARDLRPGRRRREERQPRSAVGRRGHRHRGRAVQPRASMTDEERKAFDKEHKEIEERVRQADRASSSACSSTSSARSSTRRRSSRSAATRTTRCSPTRRRRSGREPRHPLAGA